MDKKITLVIIVSLVLVISTGVLVGSMFYEDPDPPSAMIGVSEEQKLEEYQTDYISVTHYAGDSIDENNISVYFELDYETVEESVDFNMEYINEQEMDLHLDEDEAVEVNMDREDEFVAGDTMYITVEEDAINAIDNNSTLVIKWNDETMLRYDLEEQ